MAGAAGKSAGITLRIEQKPLGEPVPFRADFEVGSFLTRMARMSGSPNFRLMSAARAGDSPP